MSHTTESQPLAEGTPSVRSESEPLLSRRALFTAGLSGAALSGMSRRAAAQQGQSGVSGTTQTPTKPFDPIYFLVSRLTFGYTIADYQQAKSMGYKNYLEWQLDWENIDDSSLDALLSQFTTLDMSVADLLTNYGPQTMNSFVPATELREANVLRRVFTRRQLHEKMVTFWTNHFNVDIVDGFVRFYKLKEDREVMRPHALGRFSDLLVGDAHSPAMLYYLDNYTNFSSGVQENYARELMELHTLGVDGGFSEPDVVEAARCLTGWSITPPFIPGTPPQINPNAGEFQFLPGQHDPNPKTVLGQPITSGGKADGDELLNLLLGHRSTAFFISTKMCEWLLGYDPPESVVTRVALRYRSSGGNVKEMIREIFSEETLALIGQPNEGSVVSAESEKMRNFAKFKRPHHYTVSILRALSSTVSSGRGILTRLGTMGHSPYLWPAPNGYPDSVGAWGSALLERWAIASDITSNRLPGTQTFINTVFAPLGGVKPGKVARQINILLTGGHMHPEDEKLIDDYLQSQPQQNAKEIMEAVALGASSPSFQWY